MKLKIRFRLDNEEFFTTDEVTVTVPDWAAVIDHIRQIEANHTVLTVERVMD